MLQQVKKLLNQFDYGILLFILLVSQDRIYIKLAAILFIYVLRFNFKFNIKQSRLPLFYPLIAGIEILKYLFIGNSYLGNWATLLVSSLYWGISFLAIHQIKLSLENNSIEKLENTIKAIVTINFFYCIIQWIQVMLVTHSLNPYAVQINAPDIHYPNIIHPYGQSSGDHIRGVFYQHHQNAIISQFLFIFFLFNRQYLFATLNFLIVAAICFNLVTLLTVLICIFLLFALKGKPVKLYISCLLLFIATFYTCVTPENYMYLRNRIENSVSSATVNNDMRNINTHNKMVDHELAYHQPKKMEPKYRQAAFISFSYNYISTNDVKVSMTSSRLEQENFTADSAYNFDKVSGKKTSYRQSLVFLKSNPLYLFVGSGAGTFSSKLANNFSGVYGNGSIINKYLPAPSYKTYYSHHGSLCKYLTSLNTGKHSLNNFPNSIYNQLLTEYGLLGLLLFAIFYVFFFAKQYKKLSYGLMLLPLLLIYFNYDYYFETIDVVVFFEFLVFLDIKKNIRLQSE